MRKGGFTIVELLVVIAIIGVLAAVLLPVLGKAKAKANRVKCVTQLGQIGQAFITYAQDHGERLPWQLTPAQSRGEFGKYKDDFDMDHAAMFSLPDIVHDLASATILLSPCDPDRAPANEEAQEEWSKINLLQGRMLPAEAISYVLIDGADIARPTTVLATTRNLSTCNLSTARWRGADEPGPETMAGLQRSQGQIVLADGSARLSNDTDLGETGVLPRDHGQSTGGTYKGPASTSLLGCVGELETDEFALEPGELFQVIQSGKGNRYVFVIDCSGSMKRDGRLSMAKRELTTAIASMEPDKEFFVYYYNHDSIPMLGGIKKATKESLRITEPWINGRPAIGDTNPRKALRDAFNKTQPDTVWLLTDGIFMQQPGMIPVATLIRELNAEDKVRVNTIGFHNNRNSVDKSLGPIAAANDGTYQFVNSAPK